MTCFYCGHEQDQHLDHLFAPCGVDECACSIFDPTEVTWPGGRVVLRDPPDGEPEFTLDLPPSAADRVCQLLRTKMARPVPMNTRQALWLTHLPGDILGLAEAPLFTALEEVVDS